MSAPAPAPASSRQFFVGGNWKLNGSRALTASIVDRLNAADIPASTQVVIAPPALYVPQAASSLTNPRVSVAGQNAHEKSSGAFTGETSVEMLADVGAKWVIIGHSERREIFGESDALIARKTKHALGAGLGVIFCCGETLAQRDAGAAVTVVSSQMGALVKEVPEWSNNIVVAYEPVWAIGTGRVATMEQAQEMHASIRGWLDAKLGAGVSSSTRILYGGSVNAANCRGLATQPDVDGFLVGGASLKPEFVDICRARE